MKRFLLAVLLLVSVVFVTSATQPLYAQTNSALPAVPVEEKPVVAGYGLINPLAVNSIPQIIGQLIAWISGLAGSLFFISLLWGGAEWMTAGGSQDKTKQAMNRIKAAIFGIGIITLSYLAVSAIIGFIPR